MTNAPALAAKQSREKRRSLPLGTESSESLLAGVAAPGPPRGSNALRLLNFERRWLQTILETLLPSGVDPRLPIGAAEIPLGRFIDEAIGLSPLQFVFGLRACVWLVMLAPPFVLGRLATFAGLTQSERIRLLERLRESPVYVIREMPLLFKTVVCLAFCGLPGVQQRVGIHPVARTPPAWARDDGEASR